MNNNPTAAEIAAKFSGASITKIRRGTGAERNIMYANIISANGDVIVSATLDYCVKRMEEVSKDISYKP